MALAQKRRQRPERVVVLVGDGEMHEGAVWEALMFAGHQKLDNLLLVVDNNTRCMLNDTHKVNSLEPLADKFTAFGWTAQECDGHDLRQTHGCLDRLLHTPVGRPAALIARTIKGHGVPSLEASPICHILTISPEEFARLPGGTP
jgi:transketolase